MSVSLELYRKYYWNIRNNHNYSDNQFNQLFKNRYPEIFKNGEDRIYLPFELKNFTLTKTNVTQDKITRFLWESTILGVRFAIVDYIAGTCKKHNSPDTRIFKIGKILTIFKKKYENKKDIQIRISNHNPPRFNIVNSIYDPYLRDHCYNPYGNNEMIECWITEDYYNQLKTKFEKMLETVTKFSIEVTNTQQTQKLTQINQLIDSFANDEIRKIKNVNKFLICITRHPYDIIGMSTNRGWTSCMNHKSGSTLDSIKHDIQGGTIIAYLIYSNDKNIKHPIARIAIKPFQDKTNKTRIDYTINDTKDTILIPVQRIYGEQIPEFLKQINSFIYKTQKHKIIKNKRYEVINPNIYRDTLNYKYFSTKPKTITELNKDFIFYMSYNETKESRMASTNKLQQLFFKHLIPYQNGICGIYPNYTGAIKYNITSKTIEKVSFPDDYERKDYYMISGETNSLLKINNIIKSLKSEKINLNFNNLSNKNKIEQELNFQTIPYIPTKQK